MSAWEGIFGRSDPANDASRLSFVAIEAPPDWIPATALLRELRALGYSGGYLTPERASTGNSQSAADANQPPL
jgi:hypothetical protein